MCTYVCLWLWGLFCKCFITQLPVPASLFRIFLPLSVLCLLWEGTKHLKVVFVYFKMSLIERVLRGTQFGFLRSPWGSQQQYNVVPTKYNQYNLVCSMENSRRSGVLIISIHFYIDEAPQHEELMGWSITNCFQID